jgi:diguanylate cyclase (GGDEF)-like protein
MADTVPTGVEAPDLRQSITEALAARGLRLRFKPALERRYEDERRAQRVRDLTISGIVAMLVYNLFLIDDHVLIPDVFGYAVLVRVGIVTPIACLLLVIINVHRSPLLRETAVVAVSVLTVTGMLFLFSISHSPYVLHYHYGIELVLIATNLVMQLRFPFAVAASTIEAALYSVVLAVSPAVPPLLVQASMSLALATAGFTLLANWQIEHKDRRNFLLSLRDSLLTDEMSKQYAKLQELSSRDSLTGIANRRTFDEKIIEIWRRAIVSGEPVGVLMLDVDHFKAYNDIYGHVLGDQCLRTIATALASEVRAATDCLARYGGEEFIVVLPGVGLGGCEEIAERMRLAVTALQIPHSDAGGVGYVTVSVGVAAQRLDPSTTVTALIADADAALYEAKERGRNRVILTDLASAQSEFPRVGGRDAAAEE